MKEMDRIEVSVEKEKYAKYGVHKGMCGWICNPGCVDGYWLVNFPQYGEHRDIGTLSIREEDMIIVPIMDAKVNERILREWGGDPETWEEIL